MKLTVKNFGPIKNAKVDVKPMTVFVGPSNTGKSYLAMLIYTIVKVLKAPSWGAFSHYLFDNFQNLSIDESFLLDDKSFSKITDELFLAFLASLRKRWKDEAIRCFGEEWENIIEGKDASTSILLSGNKMTFDFLSSEKDKLPDLDFSIGKRYWKIPAKISEGWVMESRDVFDLARLMMTEMSASLNDLLGIPQPRDSSGIVKYKGVSPGTNTHYLPAVRGGLMQSHRILVSTLIDKAPTIGLTGAEIVPFTGVLADFLQKLLMIADKRTVPHRYKDINNLSKKIEQDIMLGEIKMKILVTSYPDFRYRFKDKNADIRDISLMHASSSVSELAPIVLFIRYYLSPGDVLIVEEPEAHLHPEAQRLIAGVLVELVNADVYVIVTTHSDYILEQTNNYVHASGVREKIDKQELDEEKISVYSFRRLKGKERGNTAVNKILFDSNTGFLPQAHLDVSSALYNETVDLLEKRDSNDKR